MKSTVAGQSEFPTACLMSQYCCQCKQVTCFKLLAITRYNRAHTINSLFVIGILADSAEHSQTEGIVNSVGGHQVCETCFRNVYGFRYNRFVAMKAKFHNGIFVA